MGCSLFRRIVEGDIFSTNIQMCTREHIFSEKEKISEPCFRYLLLSLSGFAAANIMDSKEKE